MSSAVMYMSHKRQGNVMLKNHSHTQRQMISHWKQVFGDSAATFLFLSVLDPFQKGEKSDPAGHSRGVWCAVEQTLPDQAHLLLTHGHHPSPHHTRRVLAQTC